MKITSRFFFSHLFRMLRIKIREGKKPNSADSDLNQREPKEALYGDYNPSTSEERMTLCYCGEGNNEGVAPGFCIVTSSLTEQASKFTCAESPLLLTSQLYKMIFDSAPVSIVVVNCQGLIVDINSYHVDTTEGGNIPKEEFLQYKIYEHPSIVRAGLVEKYRKVLDGVPFQEDDVFFPSTTRKAEGYFKIRGEPIRYKNKVVGAVMIHEEITQMKEAENELRKHRKHLEELIEERTQQLRETCRNLQNALDEIKTLQGIIPICMHCKKIRDDDGYWKQIEEYIHEHSEAMLSHSICMDCLKLHYPLEFKAMCNNHKIDTNEQAKHVSRTSL